MPPSPALNDPASALHRRDGRHTGWVLGAVAVAILLGLVAVFARLWPVTQTPSQALAGQHLRIPITQPAAPLPALLPMPHPDTARVAQFGGEHASADVRQIAQWALQSGDNGQRAVVVVDKKEAKVYVFGRDGELQGATPALMGSAIGDHTVPGVGNKPIAQVLPQERTTPAGRFIAETGLNAQGEDVVWVDYDAAVSMHRVRPNVKAERRLERLVSPTAADNRISFGCINLPVAFYEKVLSPLVRSTGAVVYVLPETQAARAFFGAP